MGASTSTSTSAEETSQSQDIASGGSDAGTDASSGASSGPAGPVCGDGVVEGDETCDDANAAPDDGCQHCTKDSIVFITSAVYQGFDLGGLHGADQRCRSLAAKAGLAGADTFRAWLSTPTSAAADRLRHSRGRYVLVNGLVVARDWDALTSGALMNPITVDEHAQTQDSVAWTGTLLSGQPALGSKFCNDWDGDFELFVTGAEGLSASTDVQWSFFAQGLCDHENRLYCIEQ